MEHERNRETTARKAGDKGASRRIYVSVEWVERTTRSCTPAGCVAAPWGGSAVLEVGGEVRGEENNVGTHRSIEAGGGG